MIKKEQREAILDATRVLWADPYIKVTHPAQIHVLVTVARDMHNRAAVARGQITARSVTPAVTALVWQLHILHPEWNYEQIAQVTRLDNIGRISEIIAGKRE